MLNISIFYNKVYVIKSGHVAPPIGKILNNNHHNHQYAYLPRNQTAGHGPPSYAGGD